MEKSSSITSPTLSAPSNPPTQPTQAFKPKDDSTFSLYMSPNLTTVVVILILGGLFLTLFTPKRADRLDSALQRLGEVQRELAVLRGLVEQLVEGR